jgi:hypothetical protein
VSVGATTRSATSAGSSMFATSMYSAT